MWLIMSCINIKDLHSHMSYGSEWRFPIIMDEWQGMDELNRTLELMFDNFCYFVLSVVARGLAL
jgi:hypothetical protein